MSQSANPFKRFLNLLPSDPLLVGTVIVVYADGTCDVEMTGGGVSRVRGEGFKTGRQVYVRAGVIESEAPDLPVVRVEI